MDVRHRLTTYTPTCNPRHMQALKVSIELKVKDVVPGTYTSTDTSSKDTSAHINCEVLDNQTRTRPLTLSVASAASITIPSSVDPPDLVKWEWTCWPTLSLCISLSLKSTQVTLQRTHQLRSSQEAQQRQVTVTPSFKFKHSDQVRLILIQCFVTTTSLLVQFDQAWLSYRPGLTLTVTEHPPSAKQCTIFSYRY
jgi:hypothetical protein